MPTKETTALLDYGALGAVLAFSFALIIYLLKSHSEERKAQAKAHRDERAEIRNDHSEIVKVFNARLEENQERFNSAFSENATAIKDLAVVIGRLEIKLYTLKSRKYPNAE